jgi:hypothetical protein
LTQGAYDQSKGFALGAELQHGKPLLSRPASVDILHMHALMRFLQKRTSEDSMSSIEASRKSHTLPSFSHTHIQTYLSRPINLTPNPPPQRLHQRPRSRSSPPSPPTPIQAIIAHPFLKAHAPPPHIILLTNPPFEETVLKQFRDECGFTGEVRRAKDALEYAAATRAVGEETGVAVLDVWVCRIQSQ